MHCIDKNNKSKEQGIYIKQEDIALAHRLAQKTYDHRVKKIVDRRLKQIESLNKVLSGTLNESSIFTLHEAA
jgi:2,3-bisphosphoglycerate-independent phosphoglycerate mutase